MKDVTEKNFGVIIAFHLPGYLALFELSFTCLENPPSNFSGAPALGRPRPAADRAHHLTGAAARRLNFSNLKNKDKFSVYLIRGKTRPSLAVCLLAAQTSVSLFRGSRDALGKFHNDRACAILG